MGFAVFSLAACGTPVDEELAAAVVKDVIKHKPKDAEDQRDKNNALAAGTAMGVVGGLVTGLVIVAGRNHGHERMKEAVANYEARNDQIRDAAE